MKICRNRTFKNIKLIRRIKLKNKLLENRFIYIGMDINTEPIITKNFKKSSCNYIILAELGEGMKINIKKKLQKVNYYNYIKNGGICLFEYILLWTKLFKM